MKTQFFKSPSGEEMAVLPRADYEKLLEAYETGIDLAEAEHILSEVRNGRMEAFPADVVFAMAEGRTPIKALRAYRGLTAQELAHRVGVSRPYISQLEAGERVGTPKLLAKIAAALDVDLDVLIQRE